MAVDSILKNTGLFQMKQHLPDMGEGKSHIAFRVLHHHYVNFTGSRMQKYWFQVSTSEGQSLILTIVSGTTTYII